MISEAGDRHEDNDHPRYHLDFDLYFPYQLEMLCITAYLYFSQCCIILDVYPNMLRSDFSFYFFLHTC